MKSSNPGSRKSRLLGAAVTTGLTVSLAAMTLEAPASSAGVNTSVPTQQASTLRASHASHAARLSRQHWHPNGDVHAIALTRTRTFLAGDFTRLIDSRSNHRVTRLRVAALDRRTGALITKFQVRVNGAVRALTVHQNMLVLGGDFTRVDGRRRQHLAAVSLGRGQLLPIYRRPVNGPVLALLSLGTRVYAGGNFNQIGSLARSKLFALTSTGRVVPNWPAQPGPGSPAFTDGGVFALAAGPGGNSVIVGGRFNTLVGRTHHHLGTIGRQSGRVQSWSPTSLCRTCAVLDFATRSKTVYVGAAGPGGYAAAFSLSRSRPLWRAHTNGDVSAIARSGKRLYIGGHFSKVRQSHRVMFARLLIGSGRPTSRQLPERGPIFPGVLDMRVRGQALWLGGDFVGIAGQRRLATVSR